MKRKGVHERLMETTWLATVACCTALHDIGLDAEEIAEEMPHCMKQLADAIIERRYGGEQRYVVLAGDAIKLGQDKAERVAAIRAGGAA